MAPCVQLADRREELSEMIDVGGGALTVRLTGIVCGVLLAPEAVMVIAAE